MESSIKSANNVLPINEQLSSRQGVTPIFRSHQRRRFMRNVQPISWGRAFGVGVFGAWGMMAFIDIFNMLGLTPFSYEVFVGSVFSGQIYGAQNWMVGFIANSVFAGLFGIFYGYMFEYRYFHASPWNGFKLSLGHTLIAAVALFPFFNAVHEFLGTGLYPSFGILGSGLNLLTPVLILLGHVLFGLTMGLLYGPVRVERYRTRISEPGETAFYPNERGVITEEEDARDRVAGY